MTASGPSTRAPTISLVVAVAVQKQSNTLVCTRTGWTAGFAADGTAAFTACGFAGTGLDYLAALLKEHPVRLLRTFRANGLLRDLDDETIRSYGRWFEAGQTLRSAFRKKYFFQVPKIVFCTD